MTVLQIVFYFCIFAVFMNSMFASLFILIGINGAERKAMRTVLHAVAYAVLALAVAIGK